jgi:twinkle protein
MQTWAELGIEIPAGAPGPEVSTTCPKCSGQRRKKTAKCLSANVVDLVFTCFHCGWSGSLKTGAQDRLHPGWQRPKWVRPTPRPTSSLHEKALTWFAKRGITADVLTANEISFASVYMPQVEDHVNALVFPYRRGGELVNHKYRDGQKNFRMDAGAERIFWRIDSINPECVLICEGEIDCLSLQVAGFASCISVPDGAPAENAKDYSSKFEFLDADADVLDPVKKIVLAVDNDAPGRRLEDELARRLGRERCYRVTWPIGCKDANDVLVQYGTATLRATIDAAEPFPIEGVFTALGESSKILQLYRYGFECGHKTGWPALDRCYTVRPGEFTVVTGTAGAGKSNWVDALLVNLARDHGWSFGIFSPENQPIEDHMARLIEKYTNLPFTDGPTQRMDESELRVGIEWVGEHFFVMLPNSEEQWKIEWILARATELVKRHGIRGLVIDPWNELEPQREKSETETEYISRVLRTVRQWGRNHGVHVWVVVHPTKLHRGDDGKYPVPTLWDCAGSAHWRNKADNGLCVWRDQTPEAPREVDIHVQKIRFRQIGRLGRVTLLYDAPTATYSEPRVEYEQQQHWASRD